MKEAGIFTPEQEKLVADALFNAVYRKKKIPKFVKYIIRVLISRIDNRRIDRLPDAWKKRLVPIVEAAFSNNLEAIEKEVATILNEKIDIPLLPEAMEQVVFEMTLKVTAIALLNYVEKNKAIAPRPAG